MYTCVQAFPLTSCSTIRWLGSGASAVGWGAGGSDRGGWSAAAAAAALLPPPLSTSIGCVVVGGVGLEDGACDGADRNGGIELWEGATGKEYNSLPGHKAMVTSLSFMTGVLASSSEDGTVKLSAAWLIENSGLRKGFSLGASKAAISTKHSLAITNRGGASGEEVAELARFIQHQVSNRWGINLVPEPNLIGF